MEGEMRPNGKLLLVSENLEAVRTYLKRMEDEIMFGTGARLVVVTADNHHVFGIPLLDARMMAAHGKGKTLMVNTADNTIILGDRIAYPPQPAPRGFIQVFEDQMKLEDIEYDNTPRGRGERRHGRQAERPVWQKDWRKK